MKKKLLFIGFLALGAIFIFKHSNQESEIEKVRREHAEFLKNHPYQKSMVLSRTERKAAGLPPNAYYEQEFLNEINPFTGKINKENVYEIQEGLRESRQLLGRVPGDASDNPWIERGPNNVGGRTRAIIFDPNDATNETVFAGGVSGGLWKNTNISNANSQWTQVDIPENLAVSAIAVDPNNTQIFYVGTGESYVNGDANGNGLWRSTDGGTNWTKVLGGITGDSYLDANSEITVNSPASIAGDYVSVRSTSFGGDLATPITGDLVLVNDGTAPTNDACTDITNTTVVNGKIAVIMRGSCNFDDKVLRAQNAGAIAVIMVNNQPTDPFSMGGDDTTITIPALMVSREDGQKIIDELGSGVNATLTTTNANAIGANVVPGIQHINDVVVRNNNGVSEVFVAVGEAGYGDSTPASALGSYSYGLFKSTNGIDYTKMMIEKTSGNNEYEPNNLEIGPDNSIYLSTNQSFAYGDGGGAIFKSTDGNSFSLIHTVPNGLRTEIALSQTNVGTVYVLAQINDTNNPVAIFKTPNDFSFVASQNLPNDADTGIPANDFTRGQSGYDLLIKVDPNNDNTVFAGGIDLFKSTNGTSSWDQISKWSNNNNLAGLNIPLVHADQHAIAFAPGSSTRMIYGTDGGVYFSNDGGTSIDARNNNYNTVQFYTVGVAPTSTSFSGDYFIAGAQDNGTQLFENSDAGIDGSVWAQSGDGAYSFFDQDGTDRYYIANFVFNRSINLFNYDTGTSVAINSEGTNNGDFINQEALDSNLDILYSNYSNGTNYVIRRYSNIKSGASSFDLTNALMDNEPSALTVSPYTTNVTNLYAGLKNGKVLKIANANVFHTWSEITGPEFVGSVSDIEFGANENEIFVTMHNYGVVSIWYSNDGGSTWQNKEGDLPDIPVKAVLQNPLNANEVIVGTDLGVWRTANFADASPNWVQSYNGMSYVKVTDLDLRDDNTVFASTYGRGVFSGKFEVGTASIDDVLLNKKIFTVYPAVSNGEFTVYAKRTLGNSKMNVFDLNGRNVYSKNLDFNQEERQPVSVNLKTGVYIVNIIDENNKKTSEKIVIK